jgi:hypothetical protein
LWSKAFRSESQNSGIQKALANHPDVVVAGQVTGMWTDQVAQAEVQTWMATNPSDDFAMLWNIMMRTLEGQGPKIQSILAKPIAMSKDQMMAAMPEDCSEDSDQWYEPGIDQWAPAAFLDNFFLRPADPEKYDPASDKKP